MALVNIHADFSRVAKALERIADALERISPPLTLPSRPAEIDDLFQLDYSEEEQKPDKRELWEDYAPRQNY